MRPLVLLLLAPAAEAATPLSTGQVQDDLWWSTCTFYLPKSARGAADELAARAAEAFPDYQVVRSFPEQPRAGLVVVLDQVGTAMPDDYLDYFGIDLTKRERKLLTRPQAGAMLAVLSGPIRGPAANVTYAELASAFASRHKGVIWDDNTRQGFGPATWDLWRLPGLTKTPAYLGLAFTTHTYRDGNGFRMVTLGLDRFGLPDLVIEHSPTNSDELGLLIQWIAQQLYEDPTLGKGGMLALDVGRLQSSWMADELRGRTGAGATLVGAVQLVQGTPQEGDAANRLVEIRFTVGSDSGSKGERIAALTTQLFGDDDKWLEGDGQAFERAKARARRELKELMARYDSLPSTSSLHVKAGFDTTDEHTEHMWVAIQGVNGDNLVGTLLNSPFKGNRYRKGQSITFQLEAVSDFIYTREDGSTQGNYTEPFLR